MDEMNLATEILHELKASARRWFIAFCIMVALEVVTIGVFIWYISLPVDEYTEYIEQESTDRSLNNIGGNIYGIETDRTTDVPQAGN